MKTILFLALLLFVWIKPVAPQDKHATDSLKHLLTTAKGDTNKVWLYDELSWQYVWSYPDSALLYAAPGLDLAQKLNFLNGQYALMGTVVQALGIKGNYSKSLQIGFQKMKLAERSNDAHRLSDAFSGIAGSYYYSGDYKNALTYYYRAKSNATWFKRNHFLMSGFIGETYFHLNNLDSAFLYIHKCYDEDAKHKHHWVVPYFYLGKIYDKKGDLKKAIYYSIVGINYSTLNLEKADGYNDIATIYKNKGDLDSSFFCASKALSISMKASLLSEVIDASGILTSLYRSKHLADSALKYQDIMLTAKDSAFSKEKIKQMENFAFDEQMRQQAILEKQDQYRTKVKMYSLLAVVAVFLVLAIILWRNNRHKQKANEQIQRTLAELKITQTQLIQSEKMASLGELTAGIAHEIQNPLNFVNNFSDVNREMLEELKAESQKLKTERDELLEIELINDLIENEQKINHHGKRADSIVKGMLEHSRSNSGQREPTDLNAMADEYLRLSYHGLRAKDKSFNAVMVTHFAHELPKINVIPQDMGRVLLNLFNNAFYAVNQKSKTAGADYKPTVEVTTGLTPPSGGGGLVITVKDNGIGIPDTIKEKIMQPFFTTKPTGEGTGLGLSLTYDMVVKGHGGTIEVDTKEGVFTEFVIRLPIE